MKKKKVKRKQISHAESTDDRMSSYHSIFHVNKTNRYSMHDVSDFKSRFANSTVVSFKTLLIQRDKGARKRSAFE